MNETPATEETDLTKAVADLIPYLLPNERVIAVEKPLIVTPTKRPDALTELMRLTHAKTPGEIGKHGPPFAALATEANEDVEELNLFSAFFGRDSLVVSSFLLPQFPLLARMTIIRLAKFQGTRYESHAEEEPGRILHEYRDHRSAIGKFLREERGWEFPYYGSVDTTPLFVKLITEYIAQENRCILGRIFTNKDGERRTILDALVGAVNWIKKRMDANPQGFVEFCRANPNGILNQAWKDSNDSYFHADGAIANHARGIASVEVQGYAYDALLSASKLYRKIFEKMPRDERFAASVADDLLSRAEKLRSSVFSEMWVEEKNGESFFALGTDRDSQGNPRQLAIRTSNMGHLLSSDMLIGDDLDTVKKRSAIVTTLLSPLMLSASGIRTLAKNEPRFRPGAYHNGSVWLWDSYMIACGLRKHGHIAAADDLEERRFAVVSKFNKFPEFAQGGDDAEPTLNERIVDIWDESRGVKNRIEQPPQEIQAWTVAAALAAKHRENEENGEWGQSRLIS